MPGVGAQQRAAQKFIVFEQFEKLNTQSVRQALKESELAWLENLQPIAPNNLAVVPAPSSSALATIPTTVASEFSATIGGVDYLFFFATNGSAYAVNVATGAVNNFAAAGTFSTAPDLTTWQATRVLINDITAGYCTFDGTLFVRQGGVSPNIVVTNGGSGYGAPPSVTISGGSGSGATAVAVVANGAVVAVNLTNQGIGYHPGDTLTVTFGTSGGSGAVGHVTMTGFGVGSVGVNNAGGFSSPGASNVSLIFSGGGGSGAAGYATIVSAGPVGIFMVASATIIDVGSGYTSPPSVSISTTGGTAPTFTSFLLPTDSVASIVLDAGGTGYTGAPAVSIVPPNGLGSGAAATATLSGTAVNALALNASAVASLLVTQHGSYGNAPGSYALTFSGGGGTGATGTATLSNFTDPVSGLNRVIISALFLTAGGSGYTSAPTVTVTGGTGTPGTIKALIASQGSGYNLTPNVLIGAGSGAAATAIVWPFVPAGTTLAVFQGRVWLGGTSSGSSSGGLLQYTGTKGYDDFAAANASGSLVISDADLIHTITALRAYNNYLYIMGDQSVKQIGNISLNAAGNVTLFTILTLSSDQGTIYPRSCASYNRVFLFANSNGIYAVFGSSVQKISDDLDGIFKLIDFSQSPQAAILDLNNIHSIAYLVRYRDPLSTTRSLLLIFNGKKWWTAAQGNSLVTMATSALLSTGKTQIYGSSGTDVTALFADATIPVAFKWQSSLTHHGNAVQRKKIIRAGFAVTMGANGTVVMTTESDEGSNTYNKTVKTGFNALSFSADASGRYLGQTITGTLAGFVGSNMTLEYQEIDLGNKAGS